MSAPRARLLVNALLGSAVLGAAVFCSPPSGPTPNLSAAFTVPAEESCDDGAGYIASSGDCVHRPENAATAPAGASAKCDDGTYSFSEHRQGTCSGHGGVAGWL